MFWLLVSFQVSNHRTSSQKKWLAPVNSPLTSLSLQQAPNTFGWKQNHWMLPDIQCTWYSKNPAHQLRRCFPIFSDSSKNNVYLGPSNDSNAIIASISSWCRVISMVARPSPNPRGQVMKSLLEKMLPGCWCLLRWEKTLVSLGGSLEMLEIMCTCCSCLCFMLICFFWDVLGSKSSIGLCAVWNPKKKYAMLSCFLTLFWNDALIDESMMNLVNQTISLDPISF